MKKILLLSIVLFSIINSSMTRAAPLSIKEEAENQSKIRNKITQEKYEREKRVKTIYCQNTIDGFKHFLYLHFLENKVSTSAFKDIPDNIKNLYETKGNLISFKNDVAQYEFYRDSFKLYEKTNLNSIVMLQCGRINL